MIYRLPEEKDKKIDLEPRLLIEDTQNSYGDINTENMLIHGDGNSNIKFKSCFDCEDFIRQANPDIILMNPPYNAKPIGIPKKYKKNWSKTAKDGKEDPTKGFVFIHFLSYSQ